MASNPDRVRPAAALLVAAVVATVVNLAQFAALELETSDVYEAVRVKSGHDAVDLVGDHFDSTQRRFLIYAQLREHAPGARVTMPRAALSTEELAGLGLAGQIVQVRGAGPTVGAETAAVLDEATVAVGEDEALGSYAVAVESDGRVAAVVVVTGPDRTYIADERLLREVTS